jgi:hypothetical protein
MDWLFLFTQTNNKHPSIGLRAKFVGEHARWVYCFLQKRPISPGGKCSERIMAPALLHEFAASGRFVAVTTIYIHG